MSAFETLPRRRWTVEEFQHAARAGVFGEDERLELLFGEIVPAMPPDPSHSGSTGSLDDILRRIFAGADCFIRAENPLVIPGDGQPEPDIAVIRGSRQDFFQHHPTPTDVLLLIEVSGSTLTTDRSVKGPLYAGAGIPEYWILNLPGRQLEVHRTPQNGVWTQTFVVPETGAVSPLAAPGATVAVADLLP